MLIRSCLITLLLGLLFITPVSAQTVEEGYEAYDAGHYQKTKEIFHTLAAQGNAQAMNAIGILYAEGKAYERDRKIACDWYEKAAHNHYLPAQYNIGNCFINNGGKPYSAKQYLYWMEKAAERNHLEAQLGLIHWYLHKHEEKSIFWAKKAAAQHNTAARVSLWFFNQDQDIQPVTFTEIACVLIKQVILSLDNKSCDN